MDQHVCLGSVIRTDLNEMPAYLHRTRKAWGTFHKWKEVLHCKSVPMPVRLDLWAKTVSASLTWGLETTRASKRCVDVVKGAQRHTIAQMLKRKRQTVAPDGSYHEGGTVETFLQFQIGVNREIKTMISNDRPHLEIRKMINARKRAFAVHILLGLASKTEKDIWSNTL